MIQSLIIRQASVNCAPMAINITFTIIRNRKTRIWTTFQNINLIPTKFRFEAGKIGQGLTVVVGEMDLARAKPPGLEEVTYKHTKLRRHQSAAATNFTRGWGWGGGEAPLERAD